MSGLSWEALEAARPEGGLFAGSDWLGSPEPLRLPPKLGKEIRALGDRLERFVKAADSLYYRSRKGSAPGWLARYLEAGKPEELLRLANHRSQREALPEVLRPDLLWTEEGLAMTELDSVPGGLGILAWLNQVYAKAGFPEVVGGLDGMREGFGALFPEGGEIWLSQESADYRPEMTWLASQVEGVEVVPAESGGQAERVYRFFELFDLPQLPAVARLVERLQAGQAEVTAPFKPHLEEKLWLALLWAKPLEPLWEREMRASHFEKLRAMVPRGWVVDPTPLPHHAVLPGLEVQDWRDLAGFTQKERELVLKVSGFSEEAWGSRGVFVGSDLSQREWAAALDRAIREFPQGPWLLQQFHKAKRLRHPYFDPETKEIREMEGRARLCPYYFRTGAGLVLGGVLATIVPADKKVIHGMRDGILVPCVFE
ncbi:MAG: hypothetical protein AAF555_04850 [Verrucomicrobiota bacterium]